MHTTLAILKEAKACVPGYTRMIGFYGVEPEVKNVEIPLWAVSLIGTSDDMLWAINNGCFIDPKVFAKFRAYTFLSVFKCLLWKARDLHRIRSLQMGFQMNVFKECVAATTTEQAEALLTKYRQYVLECDLWEHFFNHKIWSNPHQYIAYVYAQQSTQITMRHNTYLGKAVSEKATYFPYNHAWTDQENFARLCCFGHDPYPLLVSELVRNNLGAKRGIQITGMEEGGAPKFAATINVTDPRKILHLYHVLRASELDINTVIGVNAISSRIECEGFNTVGDIAEANKKELDQLNALIATPTGVEDVFAMPSFLSQPVASSTEDALSEKSALSRMKLRARALRLEEDDDSDSDTNDEEAEEEAPAEQSSW